MSKRSVVTKYLAYIFNESPWGAIAMCGPIVMQIYWEVAYLRRDTTPVLLELIDVLFSYGLLFLTTPVIIAVCLVVFRVPVRSIAKDTGAVAVGFAVGDVLAFVLLPSTDGSFDSAYHFSFGAYFMAVCVPAAAVMFSLAVAFKRLKAEKGNADTAAEKGTENTPAKSSG